MKVCQVESHSECGVLVLRPEGIVFRYKEMVCLDMHLNAFLQMGVRRVVIRCITNCAVKYECAKMEVEPPAFQWELIPWAP